MSEAKHTPGPWKARFEEAYYVTGPDLGRVAMMMNLKGAYGLGGRRTGEESAANCRLIAAAPALADIVARLTLATDEHDDKAMGTHYVDKAGVIRCKGSFLELVEAARAALALVEGA